jgi:hypothetical protein
MRIVNRIAVAIRNALIVASLVLGGLIASVGTAVADTPWGP